MLEKLWSLESKTTFFFAQKQFFFQGKKKKHRINLLNLISFGEKRKSPKLAAIRRGGGRGEKGEALKGRGIKRPHVFACC